MKKFDKKKLLLALKEKFRGVVKGFGKGLGRGFGKVRKISPPSTEDLTRTIIRYVAPLKNKVAETTTFFRLPEKFIKENRTAKIGRVFKKVAGKISLDDISKNCSIPN